ncbi:MAG: hypothetical protein LRY54_02225 [Alphaproteobacteria bacterium]|nr:hypothetical protein [Alphaproteobacteria bacterium]
MAQGIARLGHLAQLFRQNDTERHAQEAAATEVLALKITYKESALDESKYEILFMTREQADNFYTDRILARGDTIKEVSFADGIKLAKDKYCCGSSYALNDARRLQGINPVVQAMGLDI